MEIQILPMYDNRGKGGKKLNFMGICKKNSLKTLRLTINVIIDCHKAPTFTLLVSCLDA